VVALGDPGARRSEQPVLGEKSDGTIGDLTATTENFTDGLPRTPTD
jgi:hypothetical protein